MFKDDAESYGVLVGFVGGVVEEGVGLGGGIGVSLIQFNQLIPYHDSKYYALRILRKTRGNTIIILYPHGQAHRRKLIINHHRLIPVHRNALMRRRIILGARGDL